MKFNFIFCIIGLMLHLTGGELAKFQQLFPLINPLGVRIANSKYDAMEKERNERLKQISAKRTDFYKQ